MIPDVDTNRTACAPCSTCRTCHFNACPSLHGGNPERPGCSHNVPVKGQRLTDEEFTHEQARLRRVLNLRDPQSQMLAESAQITQDSDVVFSISRVEIDEADMPITIINNNTGLRLGQTGEGLS